MKNWSWLSGASSTLSLCNIPCDETLAFDTAIRRQVAGAFGANPRGAIVLTRRPSPSFQNGAKFLDIVTSDVGVQGDGIANAQLTAQMERALRSQLSPRFRVDVTASCSSRESGLIWKIDRDLGKKQREASCSMGMEQMCRPCAILNVCLRHWRSEQCRWGPPPQSLPLYSPRMQGLRADTPCRRSL